MDYRKMCMKFSGIVSFFIFMKAYRKHKIRKYYEQYLKLYFYEKFGNKKQIF